MTVESQQRQQRGKERKRTPDKQQTSKRASEHFVSSSIQLAPNTCQTVACKDLSSKCTAIEAHALSSTCALSPQLPS